MTNAYSLNSEKDQGVIFVPPTSSTDIRVPTAEELSLNTYINVKQRAQPNIRWQKFPQLPDRLLCSKV